MEPSCENIFNISRKLGLSPELQKEKSRPYHHNKKKGRVLVKNENKKTQIIKKISKGLSKKK